MTDNKIIRLLGHIVALYTKDVTTICGRPVVALLGDALDLINRQKAENDSLKVDIAKCSIRLDNLYKTADEIKSEAIKEFAKRLKDNYCFTDRWGKIIPISTVDNLVKEMTGVSE